MDLRADPHLIAFTRSQKLAKKSVPQLTRSSFHAGVLTGSKPRHIATRAIKLQPVLTSQPSDKLLIRLRLRPAQLVVEMNNGEDNAEFVTQFNQQAQQSNRINPARNRDPNPVSSPQQFLPPDMDQHAFCQFMHGNMVHRPSFTGAPRISQEP
jgi:hypothetical protein